jgi:hypothetical protein
LVYSALAAPDFERVEKFVWDQDREGNKWESSEAALRLAQDYLSSQLK